MDIRNLIAGPVIGGCASVAIMAVGLCLYGWDPGGNPGYRWSPGLWELLSPLSMLAGAAVLMSLARRPLWVFLLSIPVVFLPFLIAEFVERGQFSGPGKKDLWPLWLSLLMLASLMIHMPALGLKTIRWLRAWPEDEQSPGPDAHPCACCGYCTMSDNSHSTYEICPICGWEDDPLQFGNPDFAGGANDCSLREAQANYISFGVSDKRARTPARKPTVEDRRSENWRLP
jgi:hypothetical protein